VSIVEVCAEEVRRLGLRRVALVGTRFTMEGTFYPAVCARYGITIVIPNESERAWVHARYVGEYSKRGSGADTAALRCSNMAHPPIEASALHVNRH
jgi:aspartate/glutamate racemase